MVTLEENTNNGNYNVWVCLASGDSNFSEGFQDPVYEHIVFLAGAKSGERETSMVSVCFLDPPDPNNFIPYANVTPEILKTWLFAKIDQVAIESNNAIILGG